MKTIPAFLTWVVLTAVLHAQSPSASGPANVNPFLNNTKENTMDDLRAAIVKYTYKWDGGNESIKFNAGGTGQHIGGTTHFDILWHVKNAQEIEITRADNRDPSAKARIKFGADYKTFTGMDFGGGRPVDGYQIVPEAQPAATGASLTGNSAVKSSATGTNDDLRKAIVKKFYTWEAAGSDKKNIKFDANGTGLQSDFHFKWRIINPQGIEIVAEDSIYGNAKAVLTFSPDYTSYTGRSFDGATPISGHLAPQ